jgi:hypothetical protein
MKRILPAILAATLALSSGVLAGPPSRNMDFPTLLNRIVGGDYTQSIALVDAGVDFRIKRITAFLDYDNDYDDREDVEKALWARAGDVLALRDAVAANSAALSTLGYYGLGPIDVLAVEQGASGSITLVVLD